MLVSEAKSLGYIPKPFHNIFKDICPICGCPLNISDNLKTLFCDNPFCGRKEDMRLCHMLKNLGVKDIGPAVASKLMDSVYNYHDAVHNEDSSITHEVIAELPKSIVSPLEVFYLPIGFYPSGNNYRVNLDRYKSIQDILKNTYDYAELISKLSFPNFGKTAYRVFEGCTSFRDYMIQTNNLETSNARLVYKLGYGATAFNVIDILKYYLADFMLVDKLFRCKPLASLDLDIVITGSIFNAGKFTRDEYVHYVTNLFGGKIRLKVGKAHSTANYVIADKPSSHNSYVSAVKRQESMNREYLVTSDRFIEILREKIGENSEQKEK